MAILAAVVFIISFILGMVDSDIGYKSMFAMQLTSMMLMLCHVYKATSFYETKTKLLLSICLSINVFMALTYAHSLMFEEITYIPILVAVSLFGFLFIQRLKTNYVTDIYSCRGTYLVYKKPKTFKQLMVALFFGFSSVMIVINGTEFKFRKGKYTENPHVKKSGLVYKKVNDIDVTRARLFLGSKWNLFNNCFTVKRVLNLEHRNRKRG